MFELWMKHSRCGVDVHSLLVGDRNCHYSRKTTQDVPFLGAVATQQAEQGDFLWTEERNGHKGTSIKGTDRGGRPPGTKAHIVR